MSCPPTIEAIFARKATPAQAHALYDHLDTCADCRQSYDRHLLFESLLPAEERIDPKKRLRETLPIATPRARRSVYVISALALAACLLLLLRRPTQADEEFHARGPALPTGPALEVYRLKGGPQRATSPIDKNEDLAFAYTNPGGAKYLLVFAVDEARHVYWYYPAWSNAAETPSSISVRPSTTLVELGEGIRHDFQGHQIRVHAVWSDTPMTTREAEAKLTGVTAANEHLGWPGTTETSRAFEVR